MHSEILVLGDGVSARVVCSLLEDKGYHPSALAVNPTVVKTANMQGGVRYLESPKVEQLHYKKALGDMIAQPISGGVIINRDMHDWEKIFQDKHLEAYKHYITGLYAIEQGRPWADNILNNFFNRTEPPAYVANLTYNELLSKYDQNFDNICVKVPGLKSLNLHDRILTYENKERTCTSLSYTTLINTLPMNLFLKLTGSPVLDVFFSRNTEMVQELKGNNKDVLWYVLGWNGIKRISIINNILKVELKNNLGLSSGDRPKLLTELFFSKNNILPLLSIIPGELRLQPDQWKFNELPPNFSIKNCAEELNLIMKNMPENVHHVGRFAELKSKMMIGDIIERAHQVVETI